MKITGKSRRTKQLPTNTGKQVDIEIITPDNNSFNRDILILASAEWFKQAKDLMPSYGQSDVTVHAMFASDVVFMAAANLDSCCVIVAQDSEDNIQGAALYKFTNQVWHLDFITTAPANQTGFPSNTKIKGIGTLLLGVIADDISKQQCAQVQLHALDEHATRFWLARGFHNTQEPLRMSCQEVTQLAKTLSTTVLDDPESGDEPFAGSRRTLRRITPPRYAMLFK